MGAKSPGIQKLPKIILHPIHSVTSAMVTKCLEMLGTGHRDTKFSVLVLGGFSPEKTVVMARSPDPQVCHLVRLHAHSLPERPLRPRSPQGTRAPRGRSAVDSRAGARQPNT